MALTKDEAIKVAKDWVENKTEASRPYLGWNQFRGLMDHLALLCVAESLANGESKYQLCERLSKAHDILSNVREAGAPEIATRYWWDRDQKLSPAEQKIVDRAEATVWTRRDPMRSFQEGYESEYYTAFDRDVFYGTVADYLKEPWLRHPYLDWIMVDMLVTRELSLFGEKVKLGSPLGSLGYFKAKGNLLKTKLWGTLWTIAVPVGAIYGAFHFGYGSIGTSLLVAYGGAIAVWLALTLLHFLAGKPASPFVLWNEMYEVWKLLQGPIVNPTLVREVMAKTRDQGAVWDTPAWSIVDRVIQHDPAVWFVQEQQIWPRHR